MQNFGEQERHGVRQFERGRDDVIEGKGRDEEVQQGGRLEEFSGLEEKREKGDSAKKEEERRKNALG